MEIKFVKLSEFAFTPTRTSSQAAGFDLRSPYEYTVNVGERVMVKTDLTFQLPENTYGRIAPRSGLALNYGLDILAGVIDRDYTGNVCVLVINLGKEPYRIEKGDRVAQLICECVIYPAIVECDDLAETTRGDHGFGSSGRN